MDITAGHETHESGDAVEDADTDVDVEYEVDTDVVVGVAAVDHPQGNTGDDADVAKDIAGVVNAHEKPDVDVGTFVGTADVVYPHGSHELVAEVDAGDGIIVEDATAGVPSSEYTLTEFNSQKASLKACGLLVTYSSHVGANAAHSGVDDQVAPAQSPQNAVFSTICRLLKC